MDIAQIVLAAVEWGVVPLVLAGILIYTLFFIPEEDAPSLVKTSATAGKWAGLVILVLYIVSRRERGLYILFQVPHYRFEPGATAFSALAGFATSWFFDLIRSTRAIGLFVMALVAATSITLYAYLFIGDGRNSLVFISLGFVLGVLLHEILFPEGTPDAWSRMLRRRRERKPNPPVGSPPGDYPRDIGRPGESDHEQAPTRRA
jgi:hypothetical protein